MSDTPIVIEFDNLLSEHLAADRLYYQSTIWHTVDKIVSVLLLIMAAVLLYLGGLSPWPLVLVGLACAEWYNLFSPRPLVLRYVFRSNPKFLETYRLTFSDDGLNFKTASIDSQITWTHFNRILEDDSLILLIYGTRMYSVIPKRAFQSDDDLSRFRALVSRKIAGIATSR